MGAKQSTESDANREEITENKLVTRRGTQYSQRIKGLARVVDRKTGRIVQNDVSHDPYEINKESQKLLKQIFKKLDPKVVKQHGHLQGDIQLSFKYDFINEMLLIKVIKARDLDPKDLRGKAADPYVRMELFPDIEDQDTRKTAVIKQTLNPTFHEIFSYHVPEEAMAETKLIVQVWDSDPMGRDDFMGECLVNLSTFDFNEQPVHTAWYSLELETDLHIGGELTLTLTYQLPQTLRVTVHSATGLSMKGGETVCPYVKVTIPGVQQVFQTQVVQNTLDPVFEETFEFIVPQEEFDFRYVVFQVFDSDPSADNDNLGQVIVDLNNFDPDTGFSGEFQLADMKNSDRLRNKWSQKATAQEFREAFLAHSMFCQPKFLFQKQQGTKVITVTSKKAGAVAKLRIVNGIPVY